MSVPELRLTRGQERTYEAIRNDHPDAMVDWPGTKMIRQGAWGAGDYISVIASGDDQVFMWVLDPTGDVVLEGGGEPRDDVGRPM